MTAFWFAMVVGCWGYYPIVDKQASATLNPISMTVYKTAFNVLTFPFILWFAISQKLLEWDWRGVLLCFLSSLLTALADYAYLVLIKGSANLSWIVASTISAGILVALILSWIIFKDVMDLRTILGMVAILIGLYLVSS